MTYSIAGTGNMAWFLGTRLNKAGFKCRGIYGRNREEIMKLSTALKAPILTDLHELKDNTDFCILAVSDKSIGELAERLSFRDTVLIHTAGSVAMDVLSKSVHRAVLWPIYSILKHDLPQHRDIPFLWEGNDEHAKKIVSAITSAITDIAAEADTIQRQWMHLTAVVGNNFINHLMSIADMISKEQGLPFSFLQPILQQTFDRAKETSPLKVQTGPAKRHDQLTINQHLRLLKDHPEWAAVYQAVTNSIRDMYCPEEKEIFDTE